MHILSHSSSLSVVFSPMKALASFSMIHWEQGSSVVLGEIIFILFLLDIVSSWILEIIGGLVGLLQKTECHTLSSLIIELSALHSN